VEGSNTPSSNPPPSRGGGKGEPWPGVSPSSKGGDQGEGEVDDAHPTPTYGPARFDTACGLLSMLVVAAHRHAIVTRAEALTTNPPTEANEGKHPE